MIDARTRFSNTLRLYGTWFSLKSAAFVGLYGLIFFIVPALMSTGSGAPGWVVAILAVLAGVSVQAIASSGDPDLKYDTRATSSAEALVQTLPVTRAQRVLARLLVASLPSLAVASLPILAAPLVFREELSLSVSFVLIMLATAPLDALLIEIGWFEQWRIDGTVARRADSAAAEAAGDRARSPWRGYASLLFAASSRWRPLVRRFVRRLFVAARPALYAFAVLTFFALLDRATGARGEGVLPGFVAGRESMNYMLLNLSAVALILTPLGRSPFSGYELALRLLPVKRVAKLAILFVRQTVFAFVLVPWLAPVLVVALGTLFGRPGFELQSAGGYLDAVGTSALAMVVALPLQQLLLVLTEVWHVITGRETSDVSQVAAPVIGVMSLTTLLSTAMIAAESVVRELFSTPFVLIGIVLTLVLAVARVRLGRRLL